MKEHPILFTPEHIRKILADQKSQTRRVMKPQPAKGQCFGDIEESAEHSLGDISGFRARIVAACSAVTNGVTRSMIQHNLAMVGEPVMILSARKKWRKETG